MMLRSVSLRSICLVGLLLPAVALNGCNLSASTPPPVSPGVESASPVPQVKRMRVVATFLPMYLFTKAVAGDVADVSILIPPGTEVHDYQSKPADVQAIAQADVIVENGLGMEEFLQNTVKTAENSKLVRIDASRSIKPVKEISPVVTGKSDHDHDHDHDHAAGNPHVWLDPVLAKTQVEAIRDGLIQADPQNRAAYTANAAAYIQQLEALHQEFQQRLGRYRDRTFITFHDAFPYLAQRYQLKQVAVVTIPEDNLSPADVQAAVQAVKQFQVKALLSEPGVDNKLLTSLAQDLKLTLRPLDSLESGTLDPQHYFTVMRANLAILESAFQ